MITVVYASFLVVYVTYVGKLVRFVLMIMMKFRARLDSSRLFIGVSTMDILDKNFKKWRKQYGDVFTIQLGMVLQ